MRNTRLSARLGATRKLIHQEAGTGNVLLIPTHIVQSLWARLNIRGRRTALTTRAHEYFEKATLELADRDFEHAAHRLSGTPQQLVTHRESTNVLRTHRQLADAPHRNIQRAGSGDRS